MKSLRLIELKSRFIKKIRDFFDERGFIEVYTNLLSDEVIPEATIEYFEINHKGRTFYLLPSTEINLKRIVSLGLEAVYQISSVFRKNEVSKIHAQEFLMLEFYKRNIDYRALIDLIEDLIILLKESFSREFTNLDLKKPFRCLHFNDLYHEMTRIDLSKFDILGVNDYKEIDETYALRVEPEVRRRSIGSAVFIIDFPWITMPYAKRKDKNFIERVELYVNGVEVANGWTETNNLDEILSAMTIENEKRIQIGLNSVGLPEKLINSLKEINFEYSGMAIGIDRLFMALLDLDDISLVKMP